MLRERNNWARENEFGLPDCRLSGSARDSLWVNSTHRGRTWEKVYCANCGKLEGLVTPDWAAHVFCLCEKCAAVHGKLNLKELPKGNVVEV